MLKQKYFRGGTHKDLIYDITLYAFCLIILVVVVYPLYFIVVASVSNPTEVTNGKTWFWPSGFNVDGYKEIFRHDDIWTGYLNTIIYTLAGTLISLAVNVPAAYSLSRRELVGRKLISLYYIFTMFFNGGLITTFFTIKSFGLYNTFWVMVLPFSVVVFHMIIARTFFVHSLPPDLWDAAQIDGCSHTRYFIQIVIPLSKALLAVLTLYTAVGIWNAYFNALVYIRSEELKPLQLVIRNILVTNQQMMGTGGDGLAQMEAMRLSQLMRYSVIIITTIPIMLFYPFVQKYFNHGVMIGALKE